MLQKIRKGIIVGYIIFFLTACGDGPLNSPYPNIDTKKNILFSSFSEQPKTLDPVKSYSSNEYLFLNQIYEPSLTYHYLKRPYQLQPQTLVNMPRVISRKQNGQWKTDYIFELKKNIYYQPHPAFAKTKAGAFRYMPLVPLFLESHNINALSDFKHTSSRELIAQDYVFQIKRLADPKNGSPIASLMSEHIIGFKNFSEKLRKMRQNKVPVDLKKQAFEGAQVIDDYHYKITIKNKYPQFIYWLAMPFFSPIPWEAVDFYQQAGMSDRNISLNWYPVGTGPFMLTENNPNRRMVMKKNPNYHTTLYPSDGSKEDEKKGYLKYAGIKLPMYDKVIFSLEKESIPRWNKFLQGYYDFSGVANDSFDQAIRVTKQGKALLTPSMKQKGIRLQSSVEPSIFYMGFNMLDDIVGGDSESAQKLRQAISIAVNYEEYISIFLNGRGKLAQGPIPPGIQGYQGGKEGMNKYIYDWDGKGVKRKPLSVAKKLLEEAGYPNGRSKETGKPLILNYDTSGGSGPEEKAYFSWLRKQFNQLNISLNIRATQYNRFQQKMRTGKAQIFSWGWNADYPDPENFLFLFLSTNGKVKFHGENAANYSNKNFDDLFIQMRQLENGEERDQLIFKMVKHLQSDAPWIWGFYPKQFSLKQTWLSHTKPSPIGAGSLRYLHIEGDERYKNQKLWNQPIFWPLILCFLIFIACIAPVAFSYYKRLYTNNNLENK